MKSKKHKICGKPFLILSKILSFFVLTKNGNSQNEFKLQEIGTKIALNQNENIINNKFFWNSWKLKEKQLNIVKNKDYKNQKTFG